MYAPIFFPKAPPVSPEVLAVERALLTSEGPYHVEGRYYADSFSADRVRRQVAERMVRERARRAAYATRVAQTAPDASDPNRQTFTPRVVTWLTERERALVDTAAAECGGCLVAIHRDTPAAVRDDLVTGNGDAVLVSVARIAFAEPRALLAFAHLVRDFPAVGAYGFVSDADEAPTATGTTGAFMLGRAGMRGLLDVRTPAGWRAIRDAFAPRRLPDAFLCACVSAVLVDLRQSESGVSDGADLAYGLTHFFCAAFAPDVTRAKQLADRLGVAPTTLMTRFFRAGLPSPRRYIAFARLTWAAWLGEQPGRTLTDIARRVDASSPQSFGRTVRHLTGQSAREFRRTTTGRAMLGRFVADLVTPYRDTLRTFDPFRPPYPGQPTPPAGAAVGRNMSLHVASAPSHAHDGRAAA